MPTVINNPSTESSGSGLGAVVGIILILIVAVLFFMYALPAIRDAGSGGTNINVPDRIQIDNNGGGGQ